jgi:hypothetical protein
MSECKRSHRSGSFEENGHGGEYRVTGKIYLGRVRWLRQLHCVCERQRSNLAEDSDFELEAISLRIVSR